jgi:hypothetical protein
VGRFVSFAALREHLKVAPLQAKVPATAVQAMQFDDGVCIQNIFVSLADD